MLKISGPGWAEISIEGKVVFEGSYLTDVPCDFLKALHDYFSYNSNDIANTRGSSSVYVDCEGGVANFVFSDMFYSGNGQKVFMFYPQSVRCGDTYNTIWKIQAFDIDPYYLAIELINDIESDFENWVTWGSDDSKEALKFVRDNLNYWIDKLKEVIKNEESYEEKIKKMNTPGTEENKKIEEARKKALENLENDKDAINYEHISKHIEDENRDK